MAGKPLWLTLIPIGLRYLQSGTSTSHKAFDSPPKTKTVTRWRVGLFLCALFLVFAASLASANNLRRIVEFEPGTRIATQRQIIDASRSHIIKFLTIIDAVVIRLPTDTTQQALDYLRSHPQVKKVHIDVSTSTDNMRRHEGVEGSLITPAEPPQEPYPWNLRQVYLDEVDPTIQGDGVHVAVIDTGIDASHPALSGAVIDGYNAITDATGNASTNSLRALGEGGDGEGGDGEGGDGEGGDGEGGDGEGGDGEGGDGDAWLTYMDCNGHGTHIAGIIASNTLGIVPHAQIYAVRVLDCHGQGFVSDLIDGLSWVYDHPEIKVINMSLGFYRSNRGLYPLFHRVVKKLADAGVILVASAGNYRPDCILSASGEGVESAIAQGEGGDGEGGDGEGGDGEGGDGEGGDGEGGDGHDFVIKQLGCNTRVKFPARYPETIAVAASDINGNITYYSIHGPEVTIAAPGGTHQVPVVATTTSATSNAAAHAAASGLTATGEGGDGEGGDGEGGDGEGGDGEGGDGEGGDSEGAYGKGSGTSQAAAHVTGVVGLLLSVNPTLTPDDVQTILRETAVLINAPMLAQGYGIINAASAVQWAKDWTHSETNEMADNGQTLRRARISRHATIGDSVDVKAGVRIGRHATIGDSVDVEAGVRIGRHASIGNEVTVEAGAKIGKKVSIGNEVTIEEDVKIRKSAYIGDATTIEAGAKIGKKVLIRELVTVGHDVRVDKRAELMHNSQIMDGAIIRENAVVGEYTTLGYDTSISRNVTIGHNVAIGHGSSIRSYTDIGDVEDPNIYNTTIGDYTLIQQDVLIGINVNIGSYVVIGRGAIICDGVVIEDGTEIPPYAVVGCNN